MSKFPKKIEKTAKSIDDAVNAALSELGVTKEDAQIEIVEEGAKGFLGIGAKDAKVIVSIKDEPVFYAKRFLRDLFASMKMDVQIDASYHDHVLDINLSGEHMGIIIGKRGDTLDSIQYLTSLVVNHESEEYIKVSIDTENYRQKRTDALEQLAKRLEQKVSKSGKKYTLEPMNPYERRVIHAALQDSETVTTYSVGEDPYRKVVIASKNPRYKDSGAKALF